MLPKGLLAAHHCQDILDNYFTDGKGGKIKCTYAVMGEINNLSHQTCDKNKWSDSVFEIINFRQENTVTCNQQSAKKNKFMYLPVNVCRVLLDLSSFVVPDFFCSIFFSEKKTKLVSIGYNTIICVNTLYHVMNAQTNLILGEKLKYVT